MPVTVQLPGEGMPFWQVLGVPAGCEVSAICRSERLLSMYTHYAQRTTIPCLRDVYGSCDWCGLKSRRYAAFLAGWMPAHKRECILALTQHSVRKCRDLDRRTDLFGREIKLWRSGRHERTPVFCAVSVDRQEQLDRSKVVHPDELRRVLFNIWGIEVVVRESPPSLDLESLN